MLQCLKKMGVDRQIIFNQNLAEDAVRQKKTRQIDVNIFFLHLTCSGCQAFSNGIDCLDVVRDSCSCFFGGSRGHNGQVSDAFDLGQDCKA